MIDVEFQIETALKKVKSINDFIVYTINYKNLYGNDINKWDDDVYKVYTSVKDNLLMTTGLTDEELTLVMLSRQYNFNISWYAIKLEELYKEIGKDVKNSRATEIARELTKGGKGING